ncbi:hypothetical protein C0J52_12704 [Blattella germanica]|nr:hypothetical protein C0J52_12704 [Blattella germanica]
MADNAFHLKWNNHLQNMYLQLETLYSLQSLVDVSISCTDGILKAHRVVLSACSPYFESIFRDNHCKHPVLILKGVSSREMQALLRFMYKGSVEVLDIDLQSFMCTANELKIRGLADELLKDTIRLESEKDGDSSDDEQGKDLDLEVPVQGEGSNINDVKITDIRSQGFAENDELVTSEQNVNKEKLTLPVSKSVNNSNNPKKLDLQASKVEAVASTSNTNESSPRKSSKLPTKPYARETRFKGQKRVSVDFTSRTRFMEKRENETKLLSNEGSARKYPTICKDEQQSSKRPASSMENGKQNDSESANKNFKRDLNQDHMNPDVHIKEEVQDMDMFCISSLVERTASPDLGEDAEEECDSTSASLPFGDTSFLSSLSLGQQRYNDLTISPVIDPGPSSSRSSNQKMAEDLLQSVRQLGECTIQAFPGQAPMRTRVE